MENGMSATMSEESYNAVLEAIKTIQTHMPFLLSLSGQERRALAKMGDKSKAFVDKSAEVAALYPELLPRSFDLTEMQKDVALFDQLYGIHLNLSRLLEQVESTYFTAGADAYAAALIVYQAVRYQGNSSELEAVADALAKRFVRKGAATAGASSSTTATATSSTASSAEAPTV